jgi:hypothetical protein
VMPHNDAPVTWAEVAQCESPMDVKGQFFVEGDAARHDMKGSLETRGKTLIKPSA